MKYRIIKKARNTGKKYYIVQYLHKDEWKYLGAYRLSALSIPVTPEEFSSLLKAKQAAYRKARELAYQDYAECVDEGEV